MLELVSVHDVPVTRMSVTPVPVTLVTVIAHSCHIGSSAKSSVVNNQSTRLDSDISQNPWIMHYNQCHSSL
eukprot:1968959-Amphidinium_carterae.1